jgi:hypothetical protein
MGAFAATLAGLSLPIDVVPPPLRFQLNIDPSNPLLIVGRTIDNRKERDNVNSGGLFAQNGTATVADEIDPTICERSQVTHIDNAPAPEDAEHVVNLMLGTVNLIRGQDSLEILCVQRIVILERDLFLMSREFTCEKIELII